MGLDWIFDRLQIHEKNCHFCLHYYFDRLQFHEKKLANWKMSNFDDSWFFFSDLDAREKFWSSEENKEKERIALEKDRKKSEAKQIEGERRKREEHEANLREAAIKERERKISQIKDAEAKTLNSEKESQKKWEEQQMQDVKDEEARQNRAEELRKQRSAEAKSLIGQRSTEARAVFERNSSMGQMNFRKPSLPASNQVVTPAPTPKETVVEKPQSKPVEAKEPVVVDQQKEINANEVSTEDNIVPPPAIFGNDDNRVEVQPDVTGAAGPTQPDLIQDVAAKQGPGIHWHSVLPPIWQFFLRNWSLSK